MKAPVKSMNRLEIHYLLTNIKGVLIFILVYYHFLSSVINADGGANIAGLGRTGALLIAPIVMAMLCAVPLFVFISGYGAKNTDACRETAFSLYFIPYLLLSVLMAVEYGIVNGFPMYFFPFEPLMQLWYLMAMFLWMLLLKDLARIKGIFVVSYLVSLLIGMYFNNAVVIASSGADTFLSLFRTLYFLPFLLIGFFTKADAFSGIRRTKPIVGLAAAAAFVAASVGLMALCCRKNAANFHVLLLMKGDGEYRNHLSGVTNLQSNLLGAGLTVCLTVLCLLLAAVAIRFMPKKKIPLLTRLGDASLTVFSLHVFVTIPLSGLIAKLDVWYACLVDAAATALLCLLLSWHPVHKAYSRFVFRLGEIVQNK